MKKIITILLVIALVFVLCGCASYNKQIFDLDYNFNYAIITLPSGESIEGEVTAWNDYEQSDMVQVKMNGVTYLTHSANVILMHK